MNEDFDKYTQIAHKIELLFHLIRNIIQPINKVTYIFVTNPITIYCHTSIVYPKHKDKVLWGLELYTNYYTTFSAQDFNDYETGREDYRMLVRKKNLIGIKRVDDTSFEMIKLCDYNAF
jgi:hypothetical protein